VRLANKFGVSWQNCANSPQQALAEQRSGKAKRVMQAMLQMDKLDIARLEQA